MPDHRTAWILHTVHGTCLVDMWFVAQTYLAGLGLSSCRVSQPSEIMTIFCQETPRFWVHHCVARGVSFRGFAVGTANYTLCVPGFLWLNSTASESKTSCSQLLVIKAIYITMIVCWNSIIPISSWLRRSPSELIVIYPNYKPTFLTVAGTGPLWLGFGAQILQLGANSASGWPQVVIARNLPTGDRRRQGMVHLYPTLEIESSILTLTCQHCVQVFFSQGRRQFELLLQMWTHQCQVLLAIEWLVGY